MTGKGGAMDRQAEAAAVIIQMALNKRLYEQKRIPRGMYAAANGILSARLTKTIGCDII